MRCSFFTNLLCCASIVASETSYLFNKISENAVLGENYAPSLFAVSDVVEGISLIQDPAGNTILAGTIESQDNTIGNPNFVGNAEGNRVGSRDIFIIRFGADGDRQWSRRFGSKGKDSLHSAAIDLKSNVYLVGSFANPVNDQRAGIFVSKYDLAGSPSWTKTYEGNRAGDKWVAIEVNNDRSELIVAGTIGPLSPLHGSNETFDGSRIVVARIDATDGAVVKIVTIKPLSPSTDLLGHCLTAHLVDGEGVLYVGGASLFKASNQMRNREGGIQNSALFLLTYPELAQISRREITSQSESELTSIALSLNWLSIYASGRKYESLYTEDDALVGRFNATDLEPGWNATVGSLTFANQASVGSDVGSISEFATDTAVDKYGNVYVLLVASGPVESNDGQKQLNNKRPALLVYAPNGTLVHTVQSLISNPTRGNTMLVGDGVVLVCGWTLNNTSLSTGLYVGGLTLPSAVYRSHGDEYTPADRDQKELQKEDEQANRRLKHIMISVGAGVGGLLVAVGIIVVILTFRTRQRPSAVNSI